MKKLLLMVALLASVSMASAKNSYQKQEQDSTPGVCMVKVSDFHYINFAQVKYVKIEVKRVEFVMSINHYGDTFGVRVTTDNPVQVAASAVEKAKDCK